MPIITTLIFNQNLSVVDAGKAKTYKSYTSTIIIYTPSLLRQGWVFNTFNMKKVALFIDGSNFYHGLKSIYSDDKSLTSFNFLKLGELLTGEDRDLLRIYYYNAPLDYNASHEAYAKQQKFFEKIKSMDKVKLIYTTKG